MYGVLGLGNSKVFTECEELIQKNMTNCGFDMALIEESKAWTKDSGKKFILEKE